MKIKFIVAVAVMVLVVSLTSGIVIDGIEYDGTVPHIILGQHLQFP